MQEQQSHFSYAEYPGAMLLDVLFLILLVLFVGDSAGHLSGIHRTPPIDQLLIGSYISIKFFVV